MLRGKDRRLAAVGQRGGLVVRDHPLGVAPVAVERAEVDPAGAPIEIEGVLELERNLLRRARNHEVVGHAERGIDGVHADAVPVSSMQGGFAGPVAVGALEDLEQGTGFRLPVVEQWLERLFDACHRRRRER